MGDHKYRLECIEGLCGRCAHLAGVAAQRRAADGGGAGCGARAGGADGQIR